MNRLIKKILTAGAALVLASALLCGCAGQPQSEKKLRIVTTVFPVYDWVRNVLGEAASEAELTMLLDKGIDFHSYQPTAGDIAKIATCDVFIYVGGESDDWAENALRQSPREGRIVIDLLEALGSRARTEELPEGAQDDEHETEGEEPEYDEHLWLSLKNASLLCSVIAEKLGEADPDRRGDYAANASAYTAQLEELDSAYAEAVREAPHRTLLFADRFPFRYLAEDYGLRCFAAFSGCSAETKASFETVIFLAGKIDEYGLRSVIILEGSDRSVARTVIEHTASADQQILVLDSMQSVTAADLQKGITYLGVMRSDLAVLTAALQ